MNELNQSDFIQLLGKLIFSPDSCSFDALTNEQKEQYCSFAEAKGLGALFFRYLKDSLPEKYQRKFKQIFHAESAKCLLEYKEWKKLSNLFDQEKIPYIPIKGLDLAFNVFPEPAFRPHIDWDVLFQKKDCPKVLNILQSNGWKTITGNALKYKCNHHHYEMMKKGEYRIEVHWTLPSFMDASEEEIWKGTVYYKDSQYFLTPEMRLILLSAHSTRSQFLNTPVLKSLLDAGYILKKYSINWDKVHLLSDKWKIIRPDVLFSAWSFFFPEGVLPKDSIVPEYQKLIGEIFEMQGAIAQIKSYDRELAQNSHYNLHWFIQKLKSYQNSEKVCLTYHIKANQRTKVLFYMIYDFFAKASFFVLHHNNKNADAIRYYRMVEEVKQIRENGYPQI